MQTKTYVYKIYPDKLQREQLKFLMHEQCLLYNAALTEREGAYRKGIKLSLYDQYLHLKEIPLKGGILLARGTLKRIESAYTLFFSNLKKKIKCNLPRYKSFFRFRSLSWTEHGNGIKLNKNLLYIKDITNKVKLNYHRIIPKDAKLANCNIKLRGDNTWWFSIVVLTNEPINITNNEIGIDVGLLNLATLSDGTKIPRLAKTPKLTKLHKRKQRLLSRCLKGSKNRTKKRQQMAKIIQKITNIKNVYLHKITKDLANKYSKVYVENIKIANLKRGMLSKAFHEANISQFLNYLTYKVENTGGQIIKVAPHFTSQDCSFCGTRHKLQLNTRVFNCNNCKRELDRDINAAINILKKGGSSVPLQSEVAKISCQAIDNNLRVGVDLVELLVVRNERVNLK